METCGGVELGTLLGRRLHGGLPFERLSKWGDAASGSSLDLEYLHVGSQGAPSSMPSAALENALTVFELAEFKGRGDVQAVVLMLVVFLATQRMYHGPRTRAKAIVIDEAWDFLLGEDSRAFLEGAARHARKYRRALVTGTQSVNDYYANPAARAA